MSMKTLRSELEQLDPVLFQSYVNSVSIAEREWLPYIEVNNDSQNSLPHLKNIEEYLDVLLFSDENFSHHCLVLNGSEIYILLCSILFHDLGKTKVLNTKLTNCNSMKPEHACLSRVNVQKSWAEFGIISKQLAEIIALVCHFHDHHDSDCDRSRDLKKRLCTFMYTEHYGNIRAKSIAALLFLGDHLDGASSRTFPEYLNDQRGIVGAFRHTTQSIRVDLVNKMVCTVIEANSFKDRQGDDDHIDFKFYTEKDYKAYQSMDAKLLRRKPNEREEDDQTVTARERLLSLVKHNNDVHKSQCVVLNTIIGDTNKNAEELKLIMEPLHEIKMPLLSWFVECNGLLFKVNQKEVETTRGGKESNIYEVEDAIEPVLTSDFLLKVFSSMVKITNGNLGHNYFTYEALRNYLREPTQRVHIVKSAVLRIKKLCDALLIPDNFKENPKHPELEIYCDSSSWSIHFKSVERDKCKKTTRKFYDNLKGILEPKKPQEEVKPSGSNESQDGNVYDTTHSIILSNPLDYLLCTKPFYNPECNNVRPSKYIINSLDCLLDKFKSDKCYICDDECNYCNICNGCTNKCNLYPSDKKSVRRGLKNSNYQGGLILPCKRNENEEASDLSLPGTEQYMTGSGNVVINGDYGAGKSTLAFQIAATCANKINNGIAVYYSLESSREQLVNNFTWSDREIANQVAGKGGFVKYEDIQNDAEVTAFIKKKNNKVNVMSSFLIIDNKSDKSAEALKKKFIQALNKEKRPIPQVLIPKLSPRGTFGLNTESDLFNKRYRELKYMLIAIEQYNLEIDKNKNGWPKVKVVIVDSLNAFCDRPILRGEVDMLFDLLSVHHMLGVFTLENCVEENIVGTDYIKNIGYRADVVVSLHTSDFNHSRETYLDILKSRNIPNESGSFLYKIHSLEPYKENNENPAKRGLEIYPSLPFLVSATGIKDEPQFPSRSYLLYRDHFCLNLFGIKQFNEILPRNIVSRGCEGSSQVLMVTGQSGLCKSDLAINALFAGLLAPEIIDRDITGLYKKPKNKKILNAINNAKTEWREGENTRKIGEVEDELKKLADKIEKKVNDEIKSDLKDYELLHLAVIKKCITSSENGLIIRFGDKELFTEDGFRFSKDLLQSIGVEGSQRITLKKEELYNKLKNKCLVCGARLSKWVMTEEEGISDKAKTGKGKNAPSLSELIFTRDDIKPEEFVEVVLSVIRGNSIKRVALIDLNGIAVGYPFLMESETSGKMFLPSFVHLMRTIEVHLIMSASLSGLKESNVIVNMARELSDAVIKVKEIPDEGNSNIERKFDIECVGIEQNKLYQIEIDKNQEELSHYGVRITDDEKNHDTPKLRTFIVVNKNDSNSKQAQ